MTPTATTTAPTTTAPTAPAAPAIKKLNLGGLTAKKSSTKTEYPTLADPTGDIARLAESILTGSAELEAVETELDIHKSELRSHASQQYFTLMHGRGEIPSSMAALTADGREVLITLSNKYKALENEETVSRIIGPERAGRFFRQKTTFKVDCDLIPEDKLGDLYEELVTLFTRYACTDALGATQAIVPTKDFHTLRHTQLSVEENAAIDLVCPITAMVKTKGRGGKK